MYKKILGMIGILMLFAPMFVMPVKGVPHGLIGIGDDTELAFFAVSGDGSEENPYIISNYEITGPGICISVSGTTKYFVIEDCTLYDATYGVEFFGISKGTIRGCTIYGQEQDGIQLWDCSDCIVEDNIIYDCNTVSTGAAGINVWGSDNITIIENDIRSCVFSGIKLMGEDCIIEGNFLFNNSIGYEAGMSGIFVAEPSDNVTVQHNTGIGNAGGIFIWGCTNSYIFNNTFYLNGCFVRQEGNNYLVQWIDGTGDGLYVDDMHYSFFRNNTFRGNAHTGATFGQMTSQNEIKYNMFENNPITIYDNGTLNVIDSNYYSDYGGGGDYYLVPGTAGNKDMNPFGPVITTPIIPPILNNPVFWGVVIFVLVIGTVIFLIIRRKYGNG